MYSRTRWHWADWRTGLHHSRYMRMIQGRSMRHHGEIQGRWNVLMLRYDSIVMVMWVP